MYYNMDITDDDINLFIESYQKNLLSGVADIKIPTYVEFLKALKHYRFHGIVPDAFFYKNNNIEKEDIDKIYKLIRRVKKGKFIHHRPTTKIQSKTDTIQNNNYMSINELNNAQPRFELLSKLQQPMYEYQKKMKDLKQKRLNEMKSIGGRAWDSVEGVPDPYYVSNTYDNYGSPNVGINQKEFSRTPLFDSNKDFIINRLDEINEKIKNDSLISNDPYKHYVPMITSSKKSSNTTDLKPSLIENKYKAFSNNSHTARNWQDIDQLNITMGGKDKGIPNKQPFENQFQYLDGNYNRIPDPRILGTSTRFLNRSTMKY